MRIGYFKTWRRAVLDDMELDAKSFKLWVLMQALALHSPQRGLPPGTVIASYEDLRAGLREKSGETYSESTIHNSVETLIETGRIERVGDRPGRTQRYQIPNWLRMQREDWDAILDEDCYPPELTSIHVREQSRKNRL